MSSFTSDSFSKGDESFLVTHSSKPGHEPVTPRNSLNHAYMHAPDTQMISSFNWAEESTPTESTDWVTLVEEADQYEQLQHEKHVHHHNRQRRMVNQQHQMHQQQQMLRKYQQQQQGIFQCHSQHENPNYFQIAQPMGNLYEGIVGDGNQASSGISSDTSVCNHMHLERQRPIVDNCNNSQLLATGNNTALIQNPSQNDVKKMQYQDEDGSLFRPSRKYVQEESSMTLQTSYACLDPSSHYMAMPKLEMDSAFQPTYLDTEFDQIYSNQGGIPHDCLPYYYTDVIGDKKNIHDWRNPLCNDKTGMYNVNEIDRRVRVPIRRNHPDSMSGQNQQAGYVMQRELDIYSSEGSSQSSHWGRDGLPPDLIAGIPLESQHTKCNTNVSHETSTAKHIPCPGDVYICDTTKDSCLMLDHIVHSGRSANWLPLNEKQLCPNTEDESSDTNSKKDSDISDVKESSTEENIDDPQKFTNSTSSSPGEVGHSKEHNRTYISRARSGHRVIPHSSASFPQVNRMHTESPENAKIPPVNKPDITIVKLSKDLEKTCIGQSETTTMASTPEGIGHRNNFKKIKHFNGENVLINDTELGIRHDEEGVHRPRVILRGNKNTCRSLEEENRIVTDETKLNVGGFPDTIINQNTNANHQPRQQIYLQDLSKLQRQNHYAAMGNTSQQRFLSNNIHNATDNGFKSIETNGMHTIGSGGIRPMGNGGIQTIRNISNNIIRCNTAMSRVQLSGKNAPHHIGMTHQMYCMAPTVLVPPRPTGQQGSTGNQVIYPKMIQRNTYPSPNVSQGMVRVPLVYMQPMPVNINMISVLPANINHNNSSSSSNPNVNTNNIITINTCDNEFDTDVNDDIEANVSINQPTMVNIGNVHNELSGNYQTCTGASDDCRVQMIRKDRLLDSGLEQDSSNSLKSKDNTSENFTLSGSPSEILDDKRIDKMNPEYTGPKPDQGCLPCERKENSRVQHWSSVTDTHPEQVDIMLPIKRYMSEEGGAYWPGMERVLLTDQTQLQATRCGNRPMGVNRQHLISISPNPDVDV